MLKENQAFKQIDQIFYCKYIGAGTEPGQKSGLGTDESNPSRSRQGVPTRNPTIPDNPEPITKYEEKHGLPSLNVMVDSGVCADKMCHSANERCWGESVMRLVIGTQRGMVC